MSEIKPTEIKPMTRCRVCDCGKLPRLHKRHTAASFWDNVPHYSVVCECGRKTIESTAVSDVYKLWESVHEVNNPNPSETT